MDGPHGDARIRIEPKLVVSEFSRVLWHLRSVLAILFAVFALLCVAMKLLGGPVDLLTRAPATIPQVVYFCAITALTTGYGDVVATTDLGRLLAVVLGILGLLMAGIVTAAVVYGVQAAAHRVGIKPR
jgi:voltage-gated potassium channel